MNSFEFLGPLLFIAGVAVLVLVIVAIAQDLRQERKYGYRQAFYTIVSLVMLVLAVGSGISLLSIGLRQIAFPSAKEYQQRYNGPQALYIGASEATKVGAGVVGEAYACKTDCQFTEADKRAFADWKATYKNWQNDKTASLNTRRDLAGGLSLLIVSFPLYWFFVRWMNRGSKEEQQAHQKPSPLRSVYYYGLSFGGLVLAVVGAAMLLNSLIGTWLRTSPANSNVARPVPAVLTDTAGIDSVINCETACGFTADDVALAKQWKQDYQHYQDLQNSNTGATANDLATTIPFVAFGAPIFWLHFVRIRKETQTPPPTLVGHPTANTV